MKVAILAGGRGKRFGADSIGPPKPFVDIGGLPLLWHIMRLYGHFGHSDFVVALGHRSEEIVEQFLESRHWPGATLVLPDGSTVHRPGDGQGWHIRLVDTGPDTQSAGRIRRLRPFLEDETFMLTWCDGVADLDISALLDFHRRHGKTATLTAVHPPPRFGRLDLDGERVAVFEEKGLFGGEWINGAFFVLQPAVFDAVQMPDDTQFERAPVQQLVSSGELMAFRHDSFWRCVDFEGERQALDQLWRAGNAPWKTWTEDDAPVSHRE